MFNFPQDGIIPSTLHIEEKQRRRGRSMWDLMHSF
jgi:hypothetical protein